MSEPEYHALRRGDTLAPFEVCVSAAEARTYLTATGEVSGLWEHTVPPLALGALLLAGLMEQVPLPAGAVHTGQEFEFPSPLPVGVAVQAHLTITQQMVRQGANFVVFTSELLDGARVVLRGRTTIMAPVPPEAATQ